MSKLTLFSKIGFFLLLIPLLFIQANSAITCNSSGEDNDDDNNSCKVGSTKIVNLRIYNQFNNLASFDQNLCMPSYAFNSYPVQYMDWNTLAYYDYWFILSVEACEGSWGDYRRYCFPGQTFQTISGPPTSMFTGTGSFTPSISGTNLSLNIPSDKDFKVTIHLYSDCNQCNLNSNQNYRYLFSRETSYTQADANSGVINMEWPLYADGSSQCFVDC